MQSDLSTSDHGLRRVVTGTGRDGLSLMLEDEHVPGAVLAGQPDGADAIFFHLWATTKMPVPLDDSDLATQREATREIAAGTGSGSVLRVGVLPPGTRSPMHRTETLDYGICLEGECDMELDGGDTVTLRAGDVVIQRGTNHVWHNRSPTTCRLAWILLDAVPPTESRKKLDASITGNGSRR